MSSISSFAKNYRQPEGGFLKTRQFDLYVPSFSKEPDEEDRAFIAEIFNGVLDHLDELDEIIGKTARGWPVERMSLVDLTVLRLAVWEILYNPDIPDNVSVAEALELTERYSDPEDKPFVNGILGTVVREHKA